jgi:nucleoside phosphorylase
MSDLLTTVLTDYSVHDELTPIPWPDGLVPTPLTTSQDGNEVLPTADVLVVTWTAAESQALADILTPSVHVTEWTKYTKDWPTYEGQLTGRSPARFSECMAEYHLTRIGTKKVLCAKSNLHLATDATSLPIRQLWLQMIAEVRPSLIITTGTAGGIGTDTVLGDVAIATAAQFNCTKAFAHQPYAHERFVGQSFTPGPNLTFAESTLMPVNAAALRPVATRNPRLMYGDVETVDFFGFADTDDSYGIVKDDPKACTEEMDDATLPLALSTLEQPPNWISVRNASDPQVPSSLGDLEAQKKWASRIYLKYGYFTTVMSALAVWGIIADT